MRIGFVGTKEEMTRYQLDNFARIAAKITGTPLFIFRDYANKSESQASEIAKAMHSRLSVVSLKDDTKYSTGGFDKSGLAMCRRLVEKSQILVVAPLSEREFVRSTVWYTVRCARAENIPVYIMWPNGKCRYEGPCNTYVVGGLYFANAGIEEK